MAFRNFRNLALGLIMGVAGLSTTPAFAQMGDLSPVLLIESRPSDNPDYRRMVFVRFLSGDQVSVNYKAYNRTEFIQIPNNADPDHVSACANGPAATLAEIRAFEVKEMNSRMANATPDTQRFCIKNIQGWEAGNRATYLDPIFEGMPHAAILNN